MKAVNRALILLTLHSVLVVLILGGSVPAFAQQTATERLLELQQQQKAKQDTQPGTPATTTQNGGAVTIEATGVASYRQNDAARSRNEAIEAAQRDAVEQASGIIISSESEMRNFELVQDDVLSRSQGFIRKYEVVREGRDGPFYNVTIKAEVIKAAFLDDVNESLENLYRRVGKPRVMLVVDEAPITNGSETVSEGADKAEAAPPPPALNVVEKEIRKILLKQGFTFIDTRALTKGSLVEQAEKGRNTNWDSLLDQARTAKAEIVMIGHGQIGSTSRLNKFYVVEASVGLDVIRTDNGQIMASEVSTGKGLHINEETATVNALRKAADIITPKIMQQVTYQWIKEKNEGARVELVVRNASYGDLITLRKILSNDVRGVKKVRQRSYSDGVALLELETRDSPDRIAESLYETRFDDFSLDIVDVTANSLIVSMKKP